MTYEGGCYCGALRYVAEGEPRMKAECHCRPCAYFSGGAPNLFVVLSEKGFRYTSGTPKSFTRPDLENAVTREFCGDCGTQILTRRPGVKAVIIKAGTLDDPALFGAQQMAIYTSGKQAFNHIPDGLPAFEGLPPR
ncbi:GFA family protein [Oceanibacterium hippocampi]|uniref:Glutathione-dependent formaldehyde-activating enzyme n=1 Tax=Oceanibacterium hippocampi TaxID=745714 RepID=A0A1Y5SM04_9PROT|nr:GFA family protein [Oceanibacterium hippocampi]SLN43691.1 Glutathione-dependent formaldehyde-activating enzyme [Oceanibacterium hippocampi]